MRRCVRTHCHIASNRSGPPAHGGGCPNLNVKEALQNRTSPALALHATCADTHWPHARDKRLVGIVALGDFAVDSTEIRLTAKALTEISKPS